MRRNQVFNKLAVLLLVPTLYSVVPSAAVAEAEFPSRTIEMVVPYPPGGPTDLVARLVAMEMAQTIGQTVITRNQPGASGMIGAEAVTRSKPDGYTFLANASLHVINPLVYPSMKFDAYEDFTPITQLADVPLVLVVPEASPFQSVADIVEHAKANPGTLFFGSAGNASSQHLSGESFKISADIDIAHIPYKGSAPALTDLMGGQIQLMFDSLPSATPFIKSGQLRALAVTTADRVDALPGVPTVAESGYPDFSISTWYGLWAPKGTPEAIVNTLQEHAARALKTDRVANQYAEMGAIPVGSTPAEFAEFTRREGEKWAAIVAKSGAKAD